MPICSRKFPKGFNVKFTESLSKGIPICVAHYFFRSDIDFDATSSETF